MPARLIINADDFGLTLGINRSIEELHRAGALSSATLMANGPAFEDAVRIADRNPALGIGCHIVLVDGMPLSPPDTIASLLGPDSRSFRRSPLAFVAALLRGQIRAEHIRTEAFAQIQKLQSCGLHVTHLDTHKHAHLFPSVNKPLLEVARETSIDAIRNPFEPIWSLNLEHGTRLRRLQIRTLNRLQREFEANLMVRNSSLLTTDGTAGIAATGHLNAPTLHQLINDLPQGTWEIVCHPGYNDPDLNGIATRLRGHRDIERIALLEIIPKALSQPGAPTLIHYGEISATTPSSQPAKLTSLLTRVEGSRRHERRS